MRKLQGLVLGGAAELDSFAPQLRTLVKGLCSSASDLRSSLVKESCALFELLARPTRTLTLTLPNLRPNPTPDPDPYPYPYPNPNPNPNPSPSPKPEP